MSVETTGDRTFLRTFRLVVTIAHKPFRISIADAFGQGHRRLRLRLVASPFPARPRACGRCCQTTNRSTDSVKKNGHLEQTWPQVRRLQRHDVEQRHLRVPGDTDPIYADVPVLHRGCAGPRPRPVPRQHLAQLVRFRPPQDVARLRRRRRPDRLLHHRRPDRRRRRAPLHRSDRQGAAAAALGARLPAVALQLHADAEVREIAGRLRTDKIPADVIWLDIDYQDRNRAVHGRHQDLPRSQGARPATSQGRASGSSRSPISTSPPRRTRAMRPTTAAQAGGPFRPQSRRQHLRWPGLAVWPGPSGLPRLHREPSRATGGARSSRAFVDDGVAGFWNDMNEPAVFDTPTKTMPLDTSTASTATISRRAPHPCRDPQRLWHGEHAGRPSKACKRCGPTSAPS